MLRLSCNELSFVTVVLRGCSPANIVYPSVLLIQEPIENSGNLEEVQRHPLVLPGQKLVELSYRVFVVGLSLRNVGSEQTIRTNNASTSFSSTAYVRSLSNFSQTFLIRTYLNHCSC
jgi:hypothetical protein